MIERPVGVAAIANRRGGAYWETLVQLWPWAHWLYGRPRLGARYRATLDRWQREEAELAVARGFGSRAFRFYFVRLGEGWPDNLGEDR